MALIQELECSFRHVGGDPAWLPDLFGEYLMVTPSSKELFIMGMTHAGKTFRPSDWAERLAGVMSQFRPGGACAGSHLSYSPWCVPTVMNGVKCVVINRDLRDYEPMAWDFCLNFAKDNELQVAEACLIPDEPKKKA